jgi:hypothetical protein
MEVDGEKQKDEPAAASSSESAPQTTDKPEQTQQQVRVPHYGVLLRVSGIALVKWVRNS